MKKVILLGCLFFLFSEFTAQNSQTDEKCYSRKGVYASLGYGFPNFMRPILHTVFMSVLTPTSSNSIPFVMTNEHAAGPVLLKAEYALTKVVSVGVVFGYSYYAFNAQRSYTDYYYDQLTGQPVYGNYTDKISYKLNTYTIGPRINFHFATTQKLDPYAGVAAGYTYFNQHASLTSDNPNQTNILGAFDTQGFPVYFGLTAGLRYYPTKHFGAYAEIGWDKASLIQLGAAFKL